MSGLWSLAATTTYLSVMLHEQKLSFPNTKRIHLRLLDTCITMATSTLRIASVGISVLTTRLKTRLLLWSLVLMEVTVLMMIHMLDTILRGLQTAELRMFTDDREVKIEEEAPTPRR